MTRDEILALKPGRELDALVAEKVMGWTYGHPCPEGMDCLHWVDEKGEVRDYKPPQYSTDISAAWEVFEKNGYYGNVSYMGVEYVCTLWSKWDDEGLGVDVTATGNTAPEAICKAALLAVIGEDEHERN